MTKNISYIIGVDGGGTGTRAIVGDETGMELARGSSGPSSLANGVDFAWNSVIKAVHNAFSHAQIDVPVLSQMAIGLGLAGAHNRQWAADFVAKNPGFGLLQLETDAYTTLYGAHQGAPGGIVALGTGSVGESLLADGSRHEVGGWGFPSGDEAGGAWLGLRAVNYAEQVLDGRLENSAFATDVINHCGGHRDGMFAWLAKANQNSYAQLAPVVVSHAQHGENSAVLQIMQDAAAEIVKIALALDKSNTIPIALCGGLAGAFDKFLPQSLQERLVAPRGDSVTGAMLMIRKVMENNTC